MHQDDSIKQTRKNLWEYPYPLFVITEEVEMKE